MQQCSYTVNHQYREEEDPIKMIGTPAKCIFPRRMHMPIERELCRACLSTDDLFNWSSNVDVIDRRITYFRQCTQLNSTNEGLPQLLCLNCGAELKSACEFILRAQEADKILRQRRSTIAKRPTAMNSPEFEWVAALEEKREDLNQPVLELAKENEGDENTCVQDESSICSTESDIPNNRSSLTQDYANRMNRPTTTKIRCSGRARSETSIEQSIVCEYCSKSMAEKQLRRHIARCHKQDKFLCHACPRTFSDSTGLRQHSLTHDENRARNFTCEQCGRKFYTQGTCQTHLKTHNTNRPLFQCEQCDKSFFHKGSLKLHMQFHTGKTVECLICQKRYLRQTDLTVHLRSHSGDTPYKCSLCDKSFAQMGALNKHLLVHKGHRYQCNICGKEYMHQSTLIYHRKEHTGAPLKCGVCNAKFVKKSKMRRHIAGVHKVEDADEVDKLIVQVKTNKEYRGRTVEAT